MELKVSRSMPALKEIVFAEASRVDVIGQLAAAYGDQPAQEASRRADPDGSRLEWGTPGAGRCTGWLQVIDSGAGASELTVHVSMPADGPDVRPQPDELRQRLEDVLAELHDSVLQRVNDAS